MTSPCRRSTTLLEPFVDGELSSDKVVEVEEHIAECNSCRERVRLSNAMRSSLQHAVRRDAIPSSEFADRVARALAAERVRQERSETTRRWDDRGRPLAWRFIVPVAAAAGVTLVWGAAQYNHSQSGETASANRASMSTATPMVTAAMDELIDEFVSYHASPTDPEVTEPSLVRKLEPEVGVPVPVPSLQQYGLRWEGASVVPMHEKSQHAASLRYNFDGHRVTLYV